MRTGTTNDAVPTRSRGADHVQSAEDVEELAADRVADSRPGASGNVVLFVACFVIIVSMYGGGFSTVPAYLRDMFGTRYVGAIHGILLTAWSAAGIAGPVLINYIREYNVTHGVPKAQAYNTTMYIMAGLLVVGFIANLCVKAVDKRHHMESVPDAEIEPAGAQAMAGHAVSGRA